MHIPLDDLGERVEELDKGRPVVTVCRSGERSAAAAEELTRRGFEAENLDGGLEGWAARDLPLVTSSGAPGTAVVPPPEDGGSDELQNFHAEFVEAALAVQEHFGDREPSDEEMLAFLRERDRRR